MSDREILRAMSTLVAAGVTQFVATEEFHNRLRGIAFRVNDNAGVPFRWEELAEVYYRGKRVLLPEDVEGKNADV